MNQSLKTIRLVIEITVEGTYGNPEPDLDSLQETLVEHCSLEGAERAGRLSRLDDVSISAWTVQTCSLQPARMD